MVVGDISTLGRFCNRFCRFRNCSHRRSNSCSAGIAVTELELHKLIAEYLERVLPPRSVFHHSSNEGKRGWKAQAALKAMRVKPGWPDIEIFTDSQAYFLEIKVDKGKLRPTQVECHADLADAGFRVATCRSIDDVRNTLRGWDIPIREKMVA